MQFPLDFWDISLWLAVTAIILLVTAELIPPRYEKTSLIDQKKLEKAALVLGILFLITIALGMLSRISST